MRTRLTVTLTALALALALAPAAQADMRVGAVPNNWNYTPAQYGPQLAELDADVARVEHVWHEPLAELDADVAAIRAAGARPLIMLDDTVAPADNAAYADAAAAVAVRYPDNAGVEIWNEENTARFWGREPSAGEYAALLTASYHAIKAAAPATRVVLGGPAPTGTERDYVAAVLAQAPADVVAVHPYAPELADVIGQVAAMRAITGKPLAVTEFGWGAGPYCSGWACVDEATQAANLKGALDAFHGLGVTDAAWYELTDAPVWPDGSFCSRFDCRAGLYRHDGSARPAAAALRDWTPATLPTGSPGTPAQADAPSANAPASPRDRVTLRIRRGRAAGAARGCPRVRLRFSRPGRVRHARAPVTAGRYRLRLRALELAPARWRVRARCGDARSAVRYVRTR
jgi:hypothetical protein